MSKQADAQTKLSSFGIDKICELTAECVPQRTIAAQIGVSWATLIKYIDDDSGRTEQYARARESQADKMAEDILQIADDGKNDTYIDEDGNTRTDQDVVARSRLRIDARKWLASKMAPKKYGERLQTELSGAVKVTSAKDLSDDELAAIALQHAKQ